MEGRNCDIIHIIAEDMVLLEYCYVAGSFFYFSLSNRLFNLLTDPK